ncbi:hypothetical protein KXD93_15275 [Mucilaginibacter sp. BJC16-A38]|uniref:DUF6702 family protein n=1 Tax=Mucilaginibacter phenanthrenivorans TaxID=1234842 RepID=UPI0021576271|nr:DUF6702 family protein [Mucilaginibacter phenanthrenivorans]MCR8559017.1 hypothetical protein [Mucilaginibacter phenanthrenivorans]
MWAFIFQPLLYCYIVLGTAFPAKPPVKTFHPIHVSTTNISYNNQDSKLEVICTIFTDDFEAALVKQYHAKTDLNRADMHAAMDALVKKYIISNLQIKTGAAPLNLAYIGFEINKEATDIYFESDKIPAVKKIDADVSLLHNLFDDQINIVHITVGGVRKSEKLDYPDKRVSQVF